MKTCFIVTSSIQATDKPLTYSATRSIFSTEERFRQTMYTISSIKNNYPDAKIYIVDSSKEYSEYENFFQYFFSVEFYSLEKNNKAINHIVNNHKHKSYCESLLILTFMKQKMKELIKYDFIFKVSGRYVIEINNKPTDLSKIYFKKPMVNLWRDYYNEVLPMVDRRSIENDNYIRQYPTVVYAYGPKNIKRMLKIHENILKITSSPNMECYDTELLHYFYSREFQNEIVETDWIVSGFYGSNGMFVRY